MKASVFSPYRTRSIRPLGVMSASPSVRMKGYEIHHSRKDQPLLDVEVLAGAQARVKDVAANAMPMTNHHGIGFYIVHQGVIGTWLLVDWWIDEILLHHRLFRSSASDTSNFKPVNDGLACCTWELAVMAHERNVWIESNSIGLDDPLADYATKFFISET
ncbi:hypothetical protein [Bradyrhizobium septentrionale]|uniref:Uncharacterized protein n=1 Tax=Bradyrhizobium septentrionale TaxID=1404411 RepID=A0ABZ2P4I8_9BRAD